MSEAMNILLVEDNDIDVEILRRGLRKIGANGSLIWAKDGIEALEILRKDLVSREIPRPFIILLDINMPRMNGHEFLEALRQSEDLNDVRVFVFSTSDSKADVRLAYANKASGYIVKPAASRELVPVLETLQRFWALCEDPEDAAAAT